MPDESSLFVDMMKAAPGSNWDKAYRATDPKGPDIRPMDQKQKDVRKVKAENAKKMADIKAKKEEDDYFGYHPDDFPDGPPRPDNIDYDPYAEMDPGPDEPSMWRFLVRDETGETPEGWNKADEKYWQDYQEQYRHLDEEIRQEHLDHQSPPENYKSDEQIALEHGPSEEWIYDWIKKDYETRSPELSRRLPFERLRWAKEDYQAEVDRAVEAWRNTQKQINRSGK